MTLTYEGETAVIVWGDHGADWHIMGRGAVTRECDVDDALIEAANKLIEISCENKAKETN